MLIGYALHQLATCVHSQGPVQKLKPLTYYSFSLADVSVNLERTYYMVSEDVGVVEVCAIVDSPVNVVCPVTFAFDVILNTVGGTADGNSCMALCVSAALY